MAVDMAVWEQAAAVLSAWKLAHADMWAEVAAERGAEKARRAEELRPGIERMARGED